MKSLEEEGFRSPFAGLSLSIPAEAHRAFLVEIALALAGVVGLFVAQSGGVPVAPAVVLPALWCWTRRWNLWQARLLVLALCAGGDPVSFVLGAALGGLWAVHALMKPRTRLKRAYVPFTIFLAWCAVSALASQAREFNVLAAPFWLVTVVSPFGVCLYFARWRLSNREWPRLFLFALGAAIGQAVVAYLDSIHAVGFRSYWSQATSPDYIVGTMGSATRFGTFLIQVATVLLAVLFLRRPRGAWILYAGFLLIAVFVYTADAKTFLASFAVGWLVAHVCSTGLVLTRKRAALLASAVIVGVVAGSAIAASIVENYEARYMRYVIGSSNRKFQFVSRAVSPSNRSVSDYMLGFGPGTCGSRASNMRAHDTLYKGSSSQAAGIIRYFPAYTSAFTKRYIADLWTLDYALDAKSRSALLGNPFCSWGALIFEAGVVGLVLWFGVLWWLFRGARTVLRDTGRSHAARVGAWVVIANVCAMAISGIIAQSLEMPLMSVPLWLCAGIMHAAGEETVERSVA